jgi:Fe-S oxidoreductase
VRTTATGVQTPPPTAPPPGRAEFADALAIFPDSAPPEQTFIDDARTMVPGATAETVASRTRDFFEYLAERRREGSLATDFSGRSPGRVAYQMPCHLRAQNIGFKTRDVLQLIPGTRVSVVEKCTAMDGTWGMKKEYYPISLEFARKAVGAMDASEPDTYATDCTMSALQIEAVHGEKPAHPVSLLREAYGLPEEH